MGHLQHCRSEVCKLPSIFRAVLMRCHRVSTGYGQPSSTLYDWTLSSSDSLDPNFKLPEDLRTRLEIEKFCDRITRALYTNRRDPVGLTSDHERSTMISFLSRDFDELEEKLKPQSDSKSHSHITYSHKSRLTDQVSLIYSYVPLTFTCIFRHSLMSQLQRTTANVFCLYMSRRPHSSRMS